MSSLKQRLNFLQRWRLRAFPAVPSVPPATPAPAAPPVVAASEPAGASQPGLALHQWTMIAALLGAVGLAVLGQYVLSVAGSYARPGAVIVGAGLALLLLAQSTYRRRAVPGWLARGSARLGLLPQQPVFLTAAFAGAYAAKLLATNEALPPNPYLPFVVWIAASALAVLGCLRLGAAAPPKAAEALGPPWTRAERLAVLLLFGVALIVRLAANGQVPAALTGDEGSAGLMALAWADGSFRNPFVAGWFSFPSLYFVLPATTLSLLGRTYAALRTPSAFAGAAAVIGLYWMARPMFGRTTALLSAIALTGVSLHVHFSRIGLNNVWDSLFLVVTLALFWRGWQSGRRGYFIATGVVLGLSQYFYTSALLLPLILVAWLGLQLILDRPLARRRLPDLAMLVVTALVIYLPLGIFYLSHPHEFAAPMNRVSLLSADWFQATQQATGQPLWLILANNFKDAALGFTTVPLRAWYSAGKPLLLPLFSGLFGLGLMLLLSDLRVARNWLILLWLAGVIAIGALTESTPAGQRYVIAAPVAALLVGLAVATLAHWLSEAWPRGRWVVAGLALAAVLAGTAQDLDFYFNEYTPTLGAGDINTQVATELAGHLQDYPPGARAYFFGPPRMGWQGFSTLGFLLPNVIAADVDEVLTGPPDWPLAETHTAFIFLPERQAEAEFVFQRYPGGEAHWYYNRLDEPLFWIYEIRPD